MRRLLLTITTLAALALPPAALANPECPANMKPSGTTYGGLLGSEVTLQVSVYNTEPNPIETPKGAVHWEVEQGGTPGTEPLILAEPQRWEPLPKEQLRAWGRMTHTFFEVDRIWNAAWEVFFTEYLKVWGPGTEYPPYAELSYDGDHGRCVISSAASRYTPPFYEGVWPTRFGEERPIR